jgi:anti-sigma factor RsiW
MGNDVHNAAIEAAHRRMAKVRATIEAAQSAIEPEILASFAAREAVRAAGEPSGDEGALRRGLSAALDHELFVLHEIAHRLDASIADIEDVARERSRLRDW